MMSRCRLLIFVVSIAVLTVSALGASIPDSLQKAIDLNGEAEFFVVMEKQADVSQAGFLKSKQAKGRFVYDLLTQTAENSQMEIRTVLQAGNRTFKPYWITNMVLVTGDKDLLEEMAARSDVSAIWHNQTHQIIDPELRKNATSAPESRGVEWSVQQINADQVWNDFGVTGQGIVVMDADTGVDWDHPALKEKYRGWNGSSADHNYNWFDATGTYPNVPGDGHGHGTHTTGSMVGDDGGTNQIGVAPGARWIAAKNMTDDGNGEDAYFHNTFQWALAPTNLAGSSPNPAMAPHVINNSWGYWGGGDPQFETDIENLVAAGIVVEVSAGNEGSDCSSLRSPGDYEISFTTGATSQGGNIWYASSRGTSSLYPSIHKPDICAPGDNIRSSVPGGGYEGGWSGTSMSGPHACGVVALLLSADDSLIGDVATTRYIIEQSAVPTDTTTCTPGGGTPNNVYGWGEIDAYAAVAPNVGPSSEGKVELDSSFYSCSSTITVTLEDSDLESAGTATVQLTSNTESTPESLMLYEGEPGEFMGAMNTVTGSPAADGQLQVTHGNTITVTYQDADFGGAGSQTVTADAAVDCNPPVISNVSVAAISDTWVRIDWTTDELSKSIVNYGIGSPSWTEQSDFPTTNHSLVVEGLTDCTTYVFDVGAEDAAGNTTLDNNGGTHYVFTTNERVVFLSENMDSDPDWTTSGLWAWGQPTGQGGEYGDPDPTSGYTGSNVYGYNLSGDYPNNMSQTMYLTTSSFDCSGTTVVELNFWSWLGVEQDEYDNAYLDVSNNGGSSWTTIWENGSASLDGGVWEYWEFDITSIAAGYANVQIRWGIGPTDTGWQYCGWNIDDVVVSFTAPCGEPTSTPQPTYTPTQTPPPTATPQPTYTPEPTTTPTSSVPPLGVDLVLSDDSLHPGDLFSLTAFVSNPGPETYTDIPLVILLDVYGNYFWHPTWTQQFTYESLELDIEVKDIQLLEFTWPETGTAASGMIFYGALLSETFTEIKGSMDMVTFGWTL